MTDLRKLAQSLVYSNYAKIAYDAYCESRGWVSVRGDALPQFEAQSPELQGAWETAANATIEKFIADYYENRRVIRQHISGTA